MHKHTKKMILAGASALTLSVAGNAAASSVDPFVDYNVYMDFKPIEGSYYYDVDGDVLGANGIDGTNPFDSFDAGDHGSSQQHVAALWYFTVDSSSGDNWDPIFHNAEEGDEYQFNMMWDGNIVGRENVPEDPIYFSHVGEASDLLDTWVLNNNSQATPGGDVSPVSTYLHIDDIENEETLTGQSGYFAVVASDPNNVMLDNLGVTEGYGSARVEGSGTLAVVPLPAAGWAGMALLGAMGGVAGVRRKLSGKA